MVDLNRKFGGADARWAWNGELAGRPLTWVVGASYDRQNELRRGYNNFDGATLGVKGALRRDENNITYDVDAYTQGTWDFADAWSATLGVRRSEVHFDSEDHFITGTNGDDSGGVTYDATSPVAGLVFKAAPWIHLYASYGQGFQTPLGSELAYRADGTSGPQPRPETRTQRQHGGGRETCRSAPGSPARPPCSARSPTTRSW